MDARILTWSLLSCLALGAPLAASIADDYIIPGRARLFDGTRSGPTRACDIFTAGLADANCTDSPGYRELLFLHALARTTMLLGDPNDTVVPDGLLRWVEPFSTALTAGGDLPRHLPTWPNASSGAIGRTPCPSVAAQIDGIVAELGSIVDRPAPFVMILAPDETELKGNLEIDYADVLMLKGVLLAYRASLQEQTLFDVAGSDAGWIHDERVLVKLDAWIENAPCLLGFACPLGEDRGWRAYWADAVACYLDAVTCIIAENDPPGTDPQQDELFYIDPSAQAHIGRCAAALAAARDARADSAPQAGATAGAKVYELCDANSVRLGELVLVFEGTDTGGAEGRLTLDDGTSLEIDWFGVLDAGEIGISMFSPDQATQGWLQGALAADHNAITGAVVDFWGAEAWGMVAITARLTAAPARQPSDPNPLVGASLPAPPLETPLPLDELLARAGDKANWGM